MKRINTCLMVAVMILPSFAFCQDIVQVNSGGDARLINEPSGLRNDNNGGNTISGALIGVNATAVDNIIVHDFADLSTTPELAGAMVSGAMVTVEINEAFNAGNEGSALDTVFLHEIAIGNMGFNTGNGEITGNDTPATDGSVSFNHREEFNSGSSLDWLDVNDMAVGNLLGALTELGSAPGINLPDGSPNLPLDAGGEAYFFAIDAATAQRWVDEGLAGLALTATDNGDTSGRFNLTPAVLGPGGTPSVVTNIQFEIAEGFLLGDLNCDGEVDLLDVAPFVDAVTSGVFDPKADLNEDDDVNLLDVAPFVDVLVGG